MMVVTFPYLRRHQRFGDAPKMSDAIEPRLRSHEGITGVADDRQSQAVSFLGDRPQQLGRQLLVNLDEICLSRMQLPDGLARFLFGSHHGAIPARAA